VNQSEQQTCSVFIYGQKFATEAVQTINKELANFLPSQVNISHFKNAYEGLKFLKDKN
jgi:hypothetical protein